MVSDEYTTRNRPIREQEEYYFEIFCESQLILYKKLANFSDAVTSTLTHYVSVKNKATSEIWQFVITACTRPELSRWFEVATTMGKVACGTMRKQSPLDRAVIISLLVSPFAHHLREQPFHNISNKRRWNLVQ